MTETESLPTDPRLVGRQRTTEALGGFFTGLGLVVVVPFGFAALLSVLVSQEMVERLFPLALALLVVPAVLLARSRTRRFGRYLLLGMVVTAAIVFGVASVVVWWMVRTG